MNKILIIAIIVIIITILYLLYILYNNYFNSKIETSIKSIPKTNKQALVKNKPLEKKSIKNNNITMTLKHREKLYDIEIKLYDDSVPKTCKNFRDIAFNGINGKTYTNSTFHRVIKNFMLQGGDIINGNGTGSISIYGDTFKDENFIFKHNKPGLLSMANSGPNTNGSQFFITTVPTPHLDGKHVVFGEVIKGLEFIKNLENTDTDNNDTPLHSITIHSIKK